MKVKMPEDTTRKFVNMLLLYASKNLAGSAFFVVVENRYAKKKHNEKKSSIYRVCTFCKSET